MKFVHVFGVVFVFLMVSQEYLQSFLFFFFFCVMLCSFLLFVTEILQYTVLMYYAI
jgi:hypothetical protein